MRRDVVVEMRKKGLSLNESSFNESGKIFRVNEKDVYMIKIFGLGQMKFRLGQTPLFVDPH